MNSAHLPGFTAETSLSKTGCRYRTAASGGVASRPGFLPQLQNEGTSTTDKVCKACGCTVSGFTCDCGLRPSQTKLDCIKNGGPTTKVVWLRL